MDRAECPHMATSQGIKDNRSHLTDRVLNLTLEIIHLLTGETFSAVKSGELVAIMVPPHPFVMPEKTNERKILEVIKKMIELLTRESEIPSGHITIKQEVTIEDGSMEERQCPKGHREPCKVVMMEDQPADGSRKRHPPDRSLYSGDSTQEEQKIPHPDQRPIREELKMNSIRTGIKEEERERPVKEEDISRDIGTDGIYVTTLEEHQILALNPIVQGSSDSSDPAKYFADNPSVAAHNSKHLSERPFSCSECGKCFTQRGALVAHQRLHTGERLLSCSECGKSFVHSSVLEAHQRTHTGEKPFSCIECGQRFARKSYARRHALLHRGEKPHKCPECGKCFASKSNLVDHERTHTGEKPFLCLECGMRFTKKSSLSHHERLHRGEKPFECSECGHCFSKRWSLIEHQKTHTGERPYQCTKCGKCFGQKSALKQHQRLYCGSFGPRQCSGCDRCFNFKAALIQHERTHRRKKPKDASPEV